MSSITATRQRRFWLTSAFLIPIVSLGISGAQAQTPSEQLPPIEVTSPTDPNRTRAKPVTDQTSTSRRAVPRTSPTPRTDAASAPGPADSFTTGVGAVRQRWRKTWLGPRYDVSGTSQRTKSHHVLSQHW